MTIRNLEKLFQASSIVLIGASEKEGSLGRIVAGNLLDKDFKGKVWFVNPKHKTVFKEVCYPSMQDLPEVPNLAVIVTPAKTVPGLIDELGRRGTRAAVVISAGLREGNLQQSMLDAAKPYCLRIIGPNCIGALIPGIGLNASFAQAMPQKGNIAFISQSGALVDAILDWANGRNIGFSSMISMGDMADVDVGDLLDYLASDPHTKAILMYLEQVTHARKFMSAARSAARVKPVIVVKAGRNEAAAKAAKSHTGALAGSDQVYEAAFQRAGLVRVDDLEDLFDAAEVLTAAKAISGNRLAILTNGGGAGVLAVDSLAKSSGALASLSDKTIAALNEVLPPIWSGGNPVDIIGDATPQRYEQALEILGVDPGVDAILVMNCPTALASSADIAKIIAKGNEKPLLTCWLGDASVAEAREIFRQAKIPTFDTPAEAIKGFSYLVDYHRAQAALLYAAPVQADDYKICEGSAQDIISQALAQGKELLNEVEAKSVLSAYGIPTTPVCAVKTPEEVMVQAKRFMSEKGTPVVVKIIAPSLSHKSDVGGVALDLSTPEAARASAESMLSRFKNIQVDGFSVQPMFSRANAYELIVGVAEDKTFGPTILFGTGGTAVEAIGDRALALPPLDMNLAQQLIEKTHAYNLLKGYRDHPPANMKAIAQVLVQISDMISAHPEIQELDINPLLADEKGVIALDARIIVRKMDAAADEAGQRFAIRPYPREWTRMQTLNNDKVIALRPIRPDDEERLKEFISKSSPDDVRQRLFHSVKALSHETAALLTQIDYERVMAFVAIDEESGEMLGVAHLVSDPDYTRAEYAVMTRSDVKGQGIGLAMTRLLIDYARAQGIGELWGQIMRDNDAMLKICHNLGIRIETDRDDPVYLMARMSLQDQKV